MRVMTVRVVAVGVVAAVAVVAMGVITGSANVQRLVVFTSRQGRLASRRGNSWGTSTRRGRCQRRRGSIDCVAGVVVVWLLVLRRMGSIISGKLLVVATGATVLARVVAGVCLTLGTELVLMTVVRDVRMVMRSR